MTSAVRPILRLTVLLLFLLVSVSHAQITLDGSMVSGTAGPLTGPNYTIGANLGQTRGSNLFHSFGLFNVVTNQSATFTGPNSIGNIFGRVTGGQTSIIDGTIRSTIPNANLFLMNPAGVLFGPNASLDVQGSFHVTTADYLKFADGAKFHADLARQSVLTTAAVSAFGFLSQNPTGISIQESVLRVPLGKTLAIVGGDIGITGGPLGFFGAPGGQINLASVASPGEVPLDVRSLDVTSYPALGQIRLADSAFLGVSGSSGGSVVIRGGKILIEGGSTILANTLGSSSGGPIGIDVAVANDLFVSGGSVLQSGTTGLGDAGSIKLTAGQDISVDSARLESFASENSFGSAGDVIMVAARDLQLNKVMIYSASSGFGAAGAVDAQAGRDLQVNETTIDSFSLGFGTAGAVRAQAQRDAAFLLTQIDSSSNNGFAGAAGDVTLITGRNLTFGFGSILTSTDSFFGERAGDVAIAAQGKAVIEVSDISTGGFSTLARGGDVSIAADRLTLDLAAINTSSFGSRAGHVRIDVGELEMKNISSIRTQMLGDGAGGNIVINAERKIAISGGATTPSALDASVSQVTGFSTPNGNAGSIAITAPDITLDNTIVSSVSRGPGQGGNISVEADSLAVQNASIFSSGAFGTGPGGSISLNASESVLFSGGSGIASGSEGPGNAGTVNIQSPRVVLSGEGVVAANANGAGNGGDIRIAASQLAILDGFGLTTLTTGTGMAGVGGNIDLNVTDSVIISGASSNRPSGMFTGTLGDGNSGNISITSPFVLLDGGNIGAFSADAMHLNNQGNSGDISFNVAQLTLQNAGLVSAGIPGITTTGVGGRVTIEASQGVFIDGSSAILNGVSGSGAARPITIRAPILVVSGPNGLIESISSGSGPGGIIDIAVSSLQLRDGGVIASGSDGVGRGGAINVTASNLLISGNGGLFTDSSAAGPAGNINILAKEIKLVQGAQISAESEGVGNTGNINIIATNSLRSVGSSITTEAETSDGGNIHLTVGSLLELVSSQITATVKSGVGSGGNIIIDSQFLVLNNSHITANAFRGPGGNITIVADNFLASPDSTITASSALSTPGTVNIQAPITDLSGSLAPLPESIVQATSLLRQSCAARYGSGKLSSLASPGRGGMPFEPGGFMPSPLYHLTDASISTQAGIPASTRLASARPLYSIVSPCGKLY